jgi:hypothetical protein
LLAAVLDLAQLRALAAHFASALAYKLTGADGRAWRKSAEAERVASAFAAIAGPVSKPELHRFAHRVAPYCSMLDADVVSAIVGGRRVDDPWLLHTLPSETGDTHTLLDPDGLFPAWWGANDEVMAAALHGLSRPNVLIAGAAIPSLLLRRLSAEKVRFFTTARPRPDEPWSRVPIAAPDLWWSNEPGRVGSSTSKWIQSIDSTAERARSLFAELGERRIALPLDLGSALERSVILAVALALGTIAWELWRTRETPDPLLALTRFEDLEARVRFSASAIRVVVPLGRRHRDLYDAGLLASVRNVPWFDGRILEFYGG